MHHRTVWTVITILALFGWPQIARIARGAMLEVRAGDYVLASKALGLTNFQIMLRHALPNALGPVLAVATIALGVFIVTEASLSYLGVGLPTTVVSWGGDISLAQSRLRSGSPILFYPAGALAMTVLAFMMMGDALRDALDNLAGVARMSRTGEAPLLSVEGLEVRFGARAPAVRGVDLTVPRGHTVAVVGESGSGKSTTAAAVLGLLPPGGRITAGRIVFDGRDITSFDRRADRRLLRSIRGAASATCPKIR